MTLSSLTPLRSPNYPRPQAQQQPPVSVVRLRDPDPAPTPPAPVPPRVTRDLSVADAHALSIETVNLIFKEDKKLAGRMVIDAGRRRRAELQTPMQSLRPMAHAILIAGMKRRAEKISDADEIFLKGYLEEIGAA
jgi:hypothetical protein